MRVRSPGASAARGSSTASGRLREDRSVKEKRIIKKRRCSCFPVCGIEEESIEKIPVTQLKDKINFQDSSEEPPPQPFSTGSVVWAKLNGCPWWPGIVINPEWCGMDKCDSSERWIYWFADNKVSQIKCENIVNFEDYFYSKHQTQKKGVYRTSVAEACKETARQRGIDINDWNYEKCLSWAENKFINISMPSKEDFTTKSGISDAIMITLKEIADKNARRGANSLNFNVRGSKINMSRNKENIQMFLNNELTIDEVCVGCFERKDVLRDEIEFDSVFYEHPIFEGRLCSSCLEFLKTTLFSYEETGKHLYCCVCSILSDGNCVCVNFDCGRTYCSSCLEIFAKDMLHNISKNWTCFICDKQSSHNILLKAKNSWKNNILKLYEEPDEGTVDQIQEEFTGRKIRVLSLFDGIATGMHVLHQLGLEIDAYYAAEIDEDALSVGIKNFGDSIKCLGDVVNIDRNTLESIQPIDLLLGGSPCNDLSFVNPIRKGLHDVTGTGVLFFEFVRIKKLLREIQKPHKLFFMFENVVAMDQKFKDVISSFLQCHPVMIDAQYFSAANRARLFWGNIPGMKKMMFPSKAPELQEKLLSGFNRIATTKKLLTVTTNQNSLRREAYGPTPVIMDDEDDVPWVTELEAVFGFPHHYTDTGNLPLSRRKHLLGKAWCVDVIIHILRPLRSFFVLKESYLEK